MDKNKKENLRELLDNVIELEALIQLAIIREDCSKDLLRLIEKKRKLVSGTDVVASVATETVVEKEEVNVREETEDADMEEYSIENLADDSEFDDADTDSLEMNGQNVKDFEKEEISTDLVQEPAKKLRGRLVFNINDKYRFKKEIFNGSDADFNTTLAFVASMENYEEAEEYFIDELGLDPKKPAVSDFMTILSNYFN